MDPTPSPQADQASASPAVTAQVAPGSRLDKILAAVPRALSSHIHIMFLGALGVFLVVLPLLGVGVSQKAMLIGGNYTNVTSDLGACIAAGLTVHLVKRDRRRTQELAEHFRLIHERHDQLEAAIAEATSAADRAAAAVKAGPSGA